MYTRHPSEYLLVLAVGFIGSLETCMELPQEVVEIFLDADSKALATTGPEGLNVVPVSSIAIVDGKIWLMNYFFRKTLTNILAEPSVSLVGWKGFQGYQVRGRVTYFDQGPTFEEARQWVKERLPDRTLRGLLVLTPQAVYNISPAAA